MIAVGGEGSPPDWKVGKGMETTSGKIPKYEVQRLCTLHNDLVMLESLIALFICTTLDAEYAECDCVYVDELGGDCDALGRWGYCDPCKVERVMMLVFDIFRMCDISVTQSMVEDIVTRVYNSVYINGLGVNHGE